MTDTRGWTHGTAELSADVRIHYLIAGQAVGRRAQTVVLIHGYPQTSWQWRHVIGPLADAGFRVVAVDYRGAGFSSKPNTGYDKWTMAADLHALLRDHLRLSERLVVVGHDIGSMVAFAFALRFPKDVSHLSLSEAPLPGTLSYDAMLAKTALYNDRLWHFRFHNAPNNIAEALTAGRERQYIGQFYDRLAHQADAIDPRTRQVYAEAFEAPGAMRAGFELYRAFDRDAADNSAALKRDGRLRMPVLAMAGAHSPLLAITKPMMAEVAKRYIVQPIPSAGHWIAEENPLQFLDALGCFLRDNPPEPHASADPVTLTWIGGDLSH